MSSRFFILDAYAHIYRAYYAIRGLSASDGLPTNAVFGFTSVLLKLLKDEQPDYLVVAFDSADRTHRHEIAEDYKATRKPMPEDLQVQIPVIKEIVELIGAKAVCSPGYEADDIIGTLARIGADAGAEVYMCTNDKDALQLLNDRVHRYETKTGEVETAENLRNERGIEPDQIIDLMGLSGDTSDNISGVEGIGPKTALKLIQEFGSLENVLENAQNIKQKKRRERLMQQADQARLSKRLVTIDTDVPLGLSLDDCKLAEMKKSELRERFDKLEFKKLIGQIEKQAPVMAAEDDVDYRLVDTQTKLDSFLRGLSEQSEFAIDTETTSTSPMAATLVGMSFSWQPKVAYYLPVKAPPGSRTLDTEATVELLKPILEDPQVGKTGQNLKYDLLVLRNAGIELQGVNFDTMLASYLLDPSRRHNLDALSERFLGISKTPTSRIIGSGKKQITMDQADVDEVCRYACEDADCTWRLTETLRSKLNERSLDGVMADVELPLMDVLAEMEYNGVSIDTDLLAEMSDELRGWMEDLEDSIYEMAGGRFNINSPKQLSSVLFDNLGLSKPRKTSQGYSTSADVLKGLAHEHPLPAKVLEYRQLAKLKSTYVDALPKMLNSRTGKVHTSFNQALTATGRLSSSDPNLQNIPIRTELGRKVRKAFVPSTEDAVLLAADYSQIELRMLAHMSMDPALTKAFREGLDIHAFVAAQINSVDIDDVTPEMRSRAKAINFGIIYGLTPFGLSRRLAISRDRARQFIEDYFERYASIKEYTDTVIEDCRKNGYVTTMLNRRRYLPTIDSSNQRQKRDAERMAVNTVIQGSAADLIKMAMNRVHRRLRKEGHSTKIILQIHDELIFEVPREYLMFERALIETEMTSAAELEVPLVVNIATGSNWQEAK